MRNELAIDALQAAPRLLGCELLLDDGRRVKIVETEAYHQYDLASHSYRGKTPRTEVMFGPARHLYVYFTYGMHYCCNIVCGQPGSGQAVLLRAAEPLAGEAKMSAARHGRDGLELSNGPAKLCQALAIDKTLNGHDLAKPPLRLRMNPPLDSDQIVQTTRIGISQAKDEPYRFYIKDNSFVSRIV